MNEDATLHQEGHVPQMLINTQGSTNVTILIHCSCASMVPRRNSGFTHWLHLLEHRSIKLAIFVASIVFLITFLWAKVPILTAGATDHIPAAVQKVKSLRQP